MLFNFMSLFIERNSRLRKFKLQSLYSYYLSLIRFIKGCDGHGKSISSYILVEIRIHI